MFLVENGLGMRAFPSIARTSPAGIHFMATPGHEQAAAAYN